MLNRNASSRYNLELRTEALFEARWKPNSENPRSRGLDQKSDARNSARAESRRRARRARRPARIAENRASGRRDRERISSAAADFSTSAPAPADGSPSWMQRNVRRRSARVQKWCRRIIAGGARALRDAVEGAEDSAANGARDLVARRDFAKGDVVVGIAASGSTPYVLGALEFARRRGAVTIGITSNPKSPLAQRPRSPSCPKQALRLLPVQRA